jgi:type II secretion system protein N
MPKKLSFGAIRWQWSVLWWFLYGVACFVFAVWFTFPTESIATRVANEIRKMSHQTWQLKYSKATSYGLSGIYLYHVEWQKKNEVTGTLETQATMDSLGARLALLPLLWGQTRILFQLEPQANKGSLQGSFGWRSKKDIQDHITARLQFYNLELSSLASLLGHFGVQLGGRIQGNLWTYLSPTISNNAGEMAFQIEDLSVLSANVMGMSIPKVHLGGVKLRVDMHGGHIKIGQLEQHGTDMQLRLSGTGNMKDPLMFSSLNFCLKVRPNSQFLEKNPVITSLFKLANMQLKTDSEGFLNLPFRGTLGHPELQGFLCNS